MRRRGSFGKITGLDDLVSLGSPGLPADPNPPRDTQGRLLGGVSHNKGQQKRSELRRELLDANTPRNIRMIRDKLVSMALDGDVPAARLYLDHVIGKPIESVEVTGPDGSEFNPIKVVTAIVNAFGNDQDAQAKIGAALRALEMDVSSPSPMASILDSLPPDAARKVSEYWE